MNTTPYLIAILAASLWFAALVGWRGGNERRDVYLMLGMATASSAAAAATLF